MSDPKLPDTAVASQIFEKDTEGVKDHVGDSNDPSTSNGDDSEKAAPPPKPPGSDAPDGGAVAWLVVLGAWCTSFCSFGWLNSMIITSRT